MLGDVTANTASVGFLEGCMDCNVDVLLIPNRAGKKAGARHRGLGGGSPNPDARVTGYKSASVLCRANWAGPKPC